MCDDASAYLGTAAGSDEEQCVCSADFLGLIAQEWGTSGDGEIVRGLTTFFC